MRFITVLLLFWIAFSHVHAEQPPPIGSGIAYLEVYFTDQPDADLGTGFFIDNDGLLVTADHVLRGYTTLPGDVYNPSAARKINKIRVHSVANISPIDIDGTSLEKMLVLGAPRKGGEGLDVAVLRIPLSDSDRMKIKPLDVAFDAPLPGTGFWAFGPGCTKLLAGTTAKNQIDNSCFQPRPEPANISDGRTFGVAYYTITANIVQGFSGGPLVNSNGLVVAISSWNEANYLSTAVSRARYTAVNRLRIFLKDVRNIPESVLFADGAKSCDFVQNSDTVITPITFSEMLPLWRKEKSLDSNQCRCCCSILHRYGHELPAEDLANLACNREEDCPDLNFYHTIAQFQAPGPKSSGEQKDALIKLASLQSAATQVASPKHAAVLQQSYSKAIANIALQTDDPVNNVEALMAIQHSSSVNPTPENYNLLSALLQKSGDRSGAEIAASLAEASAYPGKASAGDANSLDSKKEQLHKSVSAVLTNETVIRRSPEDPLQGHDQPEYEISSNVAVPHGDYVFEPDPSCPTQFLEAVEKMGSALTASEVTNAIRDYAGPLQNLAGYPTLPVSSPQSTGLASTGGFISQVLQPKRFAACALVGVVVPLGSSVLNFSYFAREQGQSPQPCTGEHLDCAVGFSRWDKPAKVISTRDAIIILATYKNWSNDRNREAQLTVQFVPPRNWAVQFETQKLHLAVSPKGNAKQPNIY